MDDQSDIEPIQQDDSEIAGHSFKSCHANISGLKLYRNDDYYNVMKFENRVILKVDYHKNKASRYILSAILQNHLAKYDKFSSIDEILSRGFDCLCELIPQIKNYTQDDVRHFLYLLSGKT